jgi:hypothetical protein
MGVVALLETLSDMSYPSTAKHPGPLVKTKRKENLRNLLTVDLNPSERSHLSITLSSCAPKERLK